MIDLRPAMCRNRLRDEGKAYPRSGCNSCHMGGLHGCPCERSADRQDAIALLGATFSRPAGWTDARAIEFMAVECYSLDAIAFSRLWNEHAWLKIQREFPDFVEWMAQQK